MKRRLVCSRVRLSTVAAVCLLVIGFTGTTWAGPDGPGRMLPAGTVIFDYHVEDIDDQEWLGLFVTPTGYALKPVSPQVKVVPYEPFELEGDDPIGRVVTADGESKEPRFLFAGIPALKAGPVPTLFDGYAGLAPGYLRLGQYPGLGGVLVVEGEPAGDYPGSYTDYALHAAPYSDGDGHIMQTLVTADETYFRVPSLVWAGDLDGDGKLDLILDVLTSAEGSATRLNLYLSTMAREGQAVGLAASITYGGC